MARSTRRKSPRTPAAPAAPVSVHINVENGDKKPPPNEPIHWLTILASVAGIVAAAVTLAPYVRL